MTDKKGLVDGFMFKKINEIIDLTFETEVTRRTIDIMDSLKEKAMGHKSFDFLIPEQIDYSEFNFLDREIEIKRMPNTFSPFRALGKIKFTFSETSPATTRVKCEVIVGNNSVPLFMTIQNIALLLWSTGWILFGWRLDLLTRFGVPIGAWIVFNGISVLKILSDRKSLIDYSGRIIEVMKE